MLRVGGMVGELHGVIRDAVKAIKNGDDAEAAGMASLWFGRVEETNFEDVNFNEDIYEKALSKRVVPADMSYFTFRNHFITKVLKPIRTAILEFLQKKDSSLKRDQKELEWINGFLKNYITVGSTNRVFRELRGWCDDRRNEFASVRQFASRFFK